MRSRIGAGIAAALLLLARDARAQASTPPAGSGTITVSFQSVDHTGHRLTDGTYIDNGRSRTVAVFADVEYGVTRRLAVAFAVPYVWARYTDDDPPPPFLPFPPVDQCRCWHSAWQDFGITVRFTAIDTLDHVVVVTPIVSVNTPSHDYAYQGEAVAGRRLNEVRLGGDASYRLDAISPNLSVTGRYTYAFVQEVIDVTTNRSNVTTKVDGRIGRNWSVGAFVTWQRTHGGLRVGSLPGSDFPAPGDLTTPERLAEHDRLLRDNRTHVGTELSRRVGQSNLFVAMTWFATGTDTHAGRALTAGVSLPFRIGR